MTQQVSKAFGFSLQRIVSSAHRQIRFAAVEQGVVIPLAHIAFHNGKIQFPPVQLLAERLGVVHLKKEIGLGVGAVILRQRPRQQVHAHCRGDAEAQILGVLQGLLHLPFQLGLVVLYGGGGGQQQLPRRGQAQPFVGVVKQGRCVVLFQPADVLGYSRLGQVQLFRRPGIVHMAADRQKALHPKIQHGIPPLFVFIIT